MKNTLLLSFLLICRFLNAQVDYSISRPGSGGYAGPHKAFIGISGGAGISVGDFRNKDTYSTKSGYAQTGPLVNVWFGYKIKPNWGISALVQGQQNPVDNEAIVDVLAPTQFSGNQSQYGGNRIIESSPWQLGSAMVGLFASRYVITNEVSIVARAMAGVALAKSPKETITIESGVGSGNWIKQSSVTSPVAFSYQLGIGFKYDIGDKTCLLLNFDYCGSQPQFSGIVRTYSSSDPVNVNSFTQNIQLINIGFGIGYLIEHL